MHEKTWFDEQVPKRQSQKKKEKPKKSRHKHDWMPYKPMKEGDTGIKMRRNISTGDVSYLFMYIKKCRICGKEKLDNTMLLDEETYRQVLEDFKNWRYKT